MDRFARSTDPWSLGVLSRPMTGAPPFYDPCYDTCSHWIHFLNSGNDSTLKFIFVLSVWKTIDHWITREEKDVV